jgi:hypothetical protein
MIVLMALVTTAMATPLMDVLLRRERETTAMAKLEEVPT